MTRALDWDIKLAGVPYMLDEDDSKRALTLGKMGKEPGTVGTLGTIVIPSFHHGFSHQVARDPRTIKNSSGIDVTVPGVAITGGILAGLLPPDYGSDNWYDDQGGGACLFYPGGNPANEECILFATAKRVFKVVPSTEVVTTVYALDDTKYAFTGSVAKYRESVYFGVESDETGAARGRWGSGLVRYNAEEDTWSVVTWAKGSLVEAAKGKIWWVENRGVMGVPQVYWTDDTLFPSGPTSEELTPNPPIDTNACDGEIYKTSVVSYAACRASTGTSGTSATLIRVGQYLSGGTYNIHRGYGRINLASLPAGVTVTAVTLRLYLKTDNSTTDFTLQVRKYAWGTLAAADWRATPSADPLMGSILTGSGGWPAINNYVEIPLSVADFPTSGYFEFYLLSARDDDDPGTAPTGNEYVEFEALDHADNHPMEVHIHYDTAIPTTFAGPFPLESGGYATESSVIGPYLLNCKQDGQVYGVDEEGNPAAIIGPGLSTPGTRFGHGAIRFGSNLLVPHNDGLVSIGVPSLDVGDIHPSKVDGSAVRGVTGSGILCLASIGPRLFACAEAAPAKSAPVVSLQTYEDGDFWALVANLEAYFGVAGVLTMACSYDPGIPGYDDNTTEANSAGGTPFLFLIAPTILSPAYFGCAAKFQSLTFDFAVFASAALTLDWEYWNGSAWVDIVGETDGTSGFTADGTVSWSVAAQAGWAITTVNGVAAYYVRVTAPENPATDPTIYQVYPTGAFLTTSLVPYAMAVVKNANSLRLYVLGGESGSAPNTGIFRLSLPTLGWGMAPEHPLNGGFLETPFYLGDGEAGPVTKRFIQVRGFADDVDVNNYFNIYYLVDNPAGTYTLLSSVATEGPFSIPFPATTASLGRSVSLKIVVVASEAGTTFPRLEMPLFVDFEYVPQMTDVFQIDVLASQSPPNRTGGQRLRDDPQAILNALDALVGTVTTLEFRGNVGVPWNVLVEQLAQVEKLTPTPQEEASTIAKLQIRRL